MTGGSTGSEGKAGGRSPSERGARGQDAAGRDRFRRRPPADPTLFSKPAEGPQDVHGVLRTITFRNDDNGYTVARLDVEGHDDPVTIVGIMPGVESGDSLVVRGRWTAHKTYGPQLDIDACEVRPPSGRDGLTRYLGSGRIRGVGPVLAERIVEAYWPDVLDGIEARPAGLSRIKGISKRLAAGIAEQLAEQREAASALVFLQDHGVGTAHALRIWRHYKGRTVELVRANPYRLAEEVFGIGFRTADGIAKALGHENDAAFRVAAGLAHGLGRAAIEGHTGLPTELLCERTAAFLEVDLLRVEGVLAECLAADRLIEDGLVYLPDLHAAEVAVAAGVHRLLASGATSDGLITAIPDDALQRAGGLEPSPDQRAALATVLGSRLGVVTGGPGVGKTTIVRALIDLLAAEGLKVALAAPTGRAARRLTEACGRPASTLHRLLGITPLSQGFRAEREEPLEIDVLVVDESSMVDIALMAEVMQALPDAAGLVLVGDVDQLPSVGAGSVLSDFIRSGVVPVGRLTTIFRQAENSGIVRVAHQINAGELPRFDPGPDGQAFFVERGEASEVVAALISMATDRIPQRFGLDPRRDVQVITPMHSGPLGTAALNDALREVLNPPRRGAAEILRFGRIYRAGDKVMQVRNNYDTSVFNGDIGLLGEVDEEAGSAWVEFDGRRVDYALDDLDQLQPAYAITCHKSQGSEFPAVVLPVVSGHAVMLRRNLFYTAFTRARQVLVAVGETSALQRAARDAREGERFSRLAERLRGDE